MRARVEKVYVLDWNSWCQCKVHALSMFSSSWPIIPIDCISFLVLTSVALLGVEWRDGFYSIFIPAVTSMVGIWPVDCFRRCSSFINLFRDFHYFEHIASLIVGFALKLPPLKVVLLGPPVGYGVKENLFEIVSIHLIAIVRPGEHW